MTYLITHQVVCQPDYRVRLIALVITHCLELGNPRSVDGRTVPSNLSLGVNCSWEYINLDEFISIVILNGENVMKPAFERDIEYEKGRTKPIAELVDENVTMCHSSALPDTAFV